jgi:hypothetical protein
VDVHVIQEASDLLADVMVAEMFRQSTSSSSMVRMRRSASPLCQASPLSAMLIRTSPSCRTCVWAIDAQRTTLEVVLSCWWEQEVAPVQFRAG